MKHKADIDRLEKLMDQRAPEVIPKFEIFVENPDGESYFCKDQNKTVSRAYIDGLIKQGVNPIIIRGIKPGIPGAM